MSQPQTKEPKNAKVRVFALAKELAVETKQLLEFCKELGFAGISNQLSGLENEQVDALTSRVKKGGKSAPSVAIPVNMPPARPVVIPAAPKINRPITTIPKAKPTPSAGEVAAEVQPVPAPEVPAPSVAEIAPPAVEPEVAPSPAPVPAAEVAPVVAEAPPVQAPAPTPVNTIPTKPGPAVRKPIDLNAVRRPQTIAPSPRPAPAPEVTPPVAQTAPAAAPVVPPPVAAPQVPVAAIAAPVAAAGPVPHVAPPKHHTPPVVPPPKQGYIAPHRAGLQPNRGAAYGPQGAINPGPRPQPGGPGGQRPPQQGGPQRPGGPTGPGGPQRPGMAPPRVGPPGAGGRGGQAVPGGPMKLTQEMMDKIRRMSEAGKRVDIQHVSRIGTGPGPGGDNRGPGGPAGPARPGETPGGAAGSRTGRPAPTGDRPGVPPAPGAGAEDDDKKAGPGGVAGRDARHKARQIRGGDRRPATSTNAIVVGRDGQVELIEQSSGSRRGPRAALLRKMRRGVGTIRPKEGPVEIVVPITVRSLSEAVGIKVGELLLKLKKETNKLYAINSPVDFDIAEIIAVDKGITLVAKKQNTAEDTLLDAYKKRAETVDPELLRPRPPVVTIMGHVDHGKTSLLDRIRKSNVVDTEAGGITQVIRAWTVTHDDKPITFLDTPGHEAFTKMRARGANVTDIVVIVVAATDGVMPQTEEAISHAKAADVDIIVAINKIDMPNANVDKTRRQLYGLELLPDNMGGDVPFVETSAITGEGIDELLETIHVVAELADLKADPTHPASGTCLEAYMQGQEGVMATLLVQQGTLRKGDVVLCGATFGRVRAMYNDMGKPVDEAGPSIPVRITGLDDVPEADDPFYAADEISKAREIAEKRKGRMQEAGLNKFAPVSLENLTATRAKAKITELKVILKAEARGSVEAIRKELEKLKHDEVRCRVLHAGIGAITESDVILALTSPSDTMVIGFNVTADDPALRLAQARGVTLDEFDIIYKLTDAVKSALEGKLKPVEEVVHLGRAIIRDTFKISKVGTIAGCYVTSGVIERSARVRVIRQGVVIFPPSDKVIGLDNLKRFKDDAKEVREGFECGMKITGFDDLKVDDVIEAFKIEIRYRTL